MVFYLLDQPNDFQRKTYPGENRYLLPNPLKLGLSKKYIHTLVTDTEIKIISVYENGDIPSVSYIAPKTISLAVCPPTIPLELRAINVSKGHQIRLKINVKATLKINDVSTTIQEEILSACFKIRSNRSKPKLSIESPRIISMNPPCCPVQTSLPLWIFGSSFDGATKENTEVFLNEQKCRIDWLENNLIICMMPKIEKACQATLEIILKGQNVFKLSMPYNILEADSTLNTIHNHFSGYASIGFNPKKVTVSINEDKDSDSDEDFVIHQSKRKRTSATESKLTPNESGLKQQKQIQENKHTNIHTQPGQSTIQMQGHPRVTEIIERPIFSYLPTYLPPNLYFPPTEIINCDEIDPFTPPTELRLEDFLFAQC